MITIRRLRQCLISRLGSVRSANGKEKALGHIIYCHTETINLIEMNPILKNILAVIAGLIAGMAANMGLLMLLNELIPAPEGVDFNNMETIVQAMEAGKYEMEHFITPFVAHSAQALLGAFVAVKLGDSKHLMLALIIGGLSLVGGIMAVSMIPAPLWYNVVDLVFAYIPMSLLGWKLANK